MNVVGIIAEYNPMHNGHLYHIKKAKELTNADYTIVIMSGSFTEQGNPAVIDKFKRAEIAVQNGADLVIELPTPYATSSAENFALGAVKILHDMNIVTHIAFGAEEENLENLQKIANVYLEHKEQILSDIKEEMKKGINSALAYSNVLKQYIPNCNTDISKPNNILAIEYLKALITLKSQIKPILVHRRLSFHGDREIENTGEFASSTSIRNVLYDNKKTIEEILNIIKPVVPENTSNALIHFNPNSLNELWLNLKYEITKLGKNGLKEIYEITEGLENKIYTSALNANNYDEFLFNVKSKRYTLSRIKRICIYILLGITKNKFETLSVASYARVLKVTNNKDELLSSLTKKSNIPVITKITDELLDTFPNDIQESLKLDILATNIANPTNPNLDYTNRIKQP